MFEQFSADSRDVVGRSTTIAADLGAAGVAPAHLLIAIGDRPGEPAPTLHALGAGAAAVRGALAPAPVADPADVPTPGIERRLGWRERWRAGRGARRRAQGGTAAYTPVPFTPATKKALALGLRAAIKLDAASIEPVHVAIGVFTDPSPATLELCGRLGLAPEAARATLLRLASGGSE